MIKRTVAIDINCTPEEIAFILANMADDEQALFFNELARLTAKWDRPFCFQLQSLIQRPELSAEGIRIMEQIGEYGRCEETGKGE